MRKAACVKIACWCDDSPLHQSDDKTVINSEAS